ncbi:MAG: heat shock protein Hsp20 [Deltaproteobacteria bacterium]|nr:heat shock protein Hsp20 [Deltaproteobacteria bacterium]
MANTRQGDGGNRTQQAISTPRTQEPQRALSPRSTAIAPPIRFRSPLTTMRRMFDDLDLLPFSGSLGSPFGSSPFSMMRRMFNDMERMMETTFDVSEQQDQGVMGLAWVPRIEVSQREDKLVISADLPGIRPEQVRIYAQDNSLVIEGEREDVREGQQGDVWQSERSYGRFQRVVALPEGANSNAAEARFDNGVLEITLPVPAESRGRQIQIQTTAATPQGQKVPLQSSQAQATPPAERH